MSDEAAETKPKPKKRQVRYVNTYPSGIFTSKGRVGPGEHVHLYTEEGKANVYLKRA